MFLINPFIGFSTSVSTGQILFTNTGFTGSGNYSNGSAISYSVTGGTYDSANNNYAYSWTIPDGVTTVNIVAVGAGGGSGDGLSPGGGGGGGLAYINSYVVTPGEVCTVRVGEGGFYTSTGTTPYRTLTDGGNSSFYNASGTNVVSAGGGSTGDSFRNSANGNEQYTSLHSGGPNYQFWAQGYCGGGGGAAGYGGNGGSGYPTTTSYNYGDGGGGGGYSGASGVVGYAGGNGGYGTLSYIYVRSSTGQTVGVADIEPLGTGVYGYNGTGTSSTGGGGGGGGNGLYGSFDNGNESGNGGGVGVMGRGANGTGSSSHLGTGNWLKGSSSTKRAGVNGVSGSGNNYGWGAGVSRPNTTGRRGGSGAVRVIFGANRAFPSSNTSDM